LGLSPAGQAAVAGLGEKGDGVLGRTRNDATTGVHGVHLERGDGVRGEGKVGVHGIATTPDLFGYGVLGENSASGAAGVVGTAPNGFGVVGVSGKTWVLGSQAGVAGASDQGPGVVGWGAKGYPGVQAWGEASGVDAMGGVFAVAGVGHPAGGFIGDVAVVGTFKASTKMFQIDHPLDPGRKYLNHASVESSEMKTIYDGVVVLDARGQAVVELPAWFEALNTSVHYQLTPIGASAPDLHIAEEVTDCRFRIAGGPTGLKVCWQVTGVRHDPYAQTHPVVVEMDKPDEEQDYYLHPEPQGHPAERGIAWARRPDLMRRAALELSTSGPGGLRP
jgi:hypothetical protein